jgi:2-polyprenyl-3-methyl-5-hydroxy-6-metoxy-1,4-benzoquinol methylase
MSNADANYFDEAAANWDVLPQRVELAKAVGKMILCQVQPAHSADVLDYGCGTGLLGLFLLPHVRSVTGADNSPGMLQVLDDKIRLGGLQRMQTKKLDLGCDPMPESRYHLIAANMVMHHVDQIETLLKAFWQMLTPGGALAIADLDTEPGLFHGPDVAASVYHHGFDRQVFMEQFRQAGFLGVKDATAHIVRKPIASGEIHEFPVFLIVGQRG